MRRSTVIALVFLSLSLTGCRGLFRDRLRADYEAGRISKGEYEQRTLERQEALARAAPAHWELQQTISQNHAMLPPE